MSPLKPPKKEKFNVSSLFETRSTRIPQSVPDYDLKVQFEQINMSQEVLKYLQNPKVSESIKRNFIMTFGKIRKLNMN